MLGAVEPTSSGWARTSAWCSPSRTWSAAAKTHPELRVSSAGLGALRESSPRPVLQPGVQVGGGSAVGSQHQLPSMPPAGAQDILPLHGPLCLGRPLLVPTDGPHSRLGPCRRRRRRPRCQPSPVILAAGSPDCAQQESQGPEGREAPGWPGKVLGLLTASMASRPASRLLSSPALLREDKGTGRVQGH